MKNGFTLIELLIVIAIIAILALIAVPNFMEAQTRAKVSRVKADMRSLATAIESYFVDFNNYPLRLRTGDQMSSPYSHAWWLWYREWDPTDSHFLAFQCLSTPIAYFTSPPIDPFTPDSDSIFQPGSGSEATRYDWSYFFYNFVSAAYQYKIGDLEDGAGGTTRIPPVVAPAPLKFNGPGSQTYNAMWALLSVGPDRSMLGTHGVNAWNIIWYNNTWEACVENGATDFYDPSNGTNSGGDIWRLSGGVMGE